MRLARTKGISAHETYPVYHFLYSHIALYIKRLKSEGHSTKSPEYREQLIEGLNAAGEKLAKYYYKTENGVTYPAAMLLNPFMKDKLFLRGAWAVPHDETGWAVRYKQALTTHYEKYYASSEDLSCDRGASQGPSQTLLSHTSRAAENRNTRAAPPTLSAVALWGSSSDAEDDEGHAGNGSRPGNHINEYLSRAREHTKGYFNENDSAATTRAVLGYWKEREAVWPKLAIMARDILAVPATSIDVEQIFSEARHIVTAQRHRLDRDTISNLMFYRGAALRKKRKIDSLIQDDFEAWADLKAVTEELTGTNTLEVDVMCNAFATDETMAAVMSRAEKGLQDVAQH
ncbi:protein of unknown function [Taphrina deformans PYCC 5710]|uniref:HAT C-terminal dimerisation domain-containing protein n=1 Tax=Taphrina deformans (strain PYCC 5710 / ATCC 11124 / CBS 356.35 / IMI 108563 / JCM 9778 / NBRC 8474) TaxID=1097556 RepID=R4XPD4_TAPDE|nr:protein of unknown function [Taphrina deformans PYCC 5710]|eukprot:CCG85095.1 protein of unknown function [Taphrina deformans PYCC 5710]